ncbi:MAG: PVC-type heme-binding CxxCH protein [Isosphaeraceae bacterium]
MPSFPARMLLLPMAVLFAGSVPPPNAPAQVSAEESARKLRPAAGLEATLFAAEPLVINPTTIDVDSRGRVWVAEGLNYRHTLHKDQKKFDDADAIKILEDTDGDGKADKVTVFADKIFPVPMGIAVEEIWQGSTYKGCRVYVGNSPDLLVLEDTDGDDKADRRYPLLTGFGGYDHDHGVHGMTFGPDGKMYLTQGDGGRKVEGGGKPGQFEVIDRSGRKVFNDQLGSTLRVNRDGTQFEILADRQRNDYETCVNAFGQVFTSDNDDDGNRGSRVIWVMDGGRYGYRTPGSPRHWGEDVPGNVPKLVGTGNGSPCGVAVYEGSLLPREYHGCVLEAEAGPRVIYAFPLSRKGAAFRTEIKTLLASEDPWFRPVDVSTAADGSVFVADWYDAGVGGHAFRDQTTGRIYRVAPTGHAWKPARPDFGTIAGRVAALQSPNVAARDAARRLLIADGQAAVPPLTELFRKGEPASRARALWILAELAGPAPVIAALKDDDPQIRELAVRILGRDDRDNGQVEYTKPEGKLPPPAQKHLLTLLALAGDPDAGVRRELILALRRMPTSEVGDALRLLAASWDGQDRWYLEALGLALRHRESDYLAKLFDGTLYGPLKLAEAGQAVAVALPPYFPIDRNEAFLSSSDPEPPPASALSKNLGLAWQVHRAETLPMLAKVMPALQSAELQQAADGVLMQVEDPAAAVTLAKLIGQINDPVRKRAMLATLSRKIDGAGNRPRPNRPSPA